MSLPIGKSNNKEVGVNLYISGTTVKSTQGRVKKTKIKANSMAKTPAPATPNALAVHLLSHPEAEV